MTYPPERLAQSLAALAKARAIQQQMYAAQRATNPWGLTAGEVSVMRAIVESGSHKLAARELGLSHRSVADRAHVIKKKMPYRTALLRYLEFDRWIRGKSE